MVFSFVHFVIYGGKPKKREIRIASGKTLITSAGLGSKHVFQMKAQIASFKNMK
jgi:hypothetical protein